MIATWIYKNRNSALYTTSASVAANLPLELAVATDEHDVGAGGTERLAADARRFIQPALLPEGSATEHMPRLPEGMQLPQAVSDALFGVAGAKRSTRP
jgi:hypothetical protein